MVTFILYVLALLMLSPYFNGLFRDNKKDLLIQLILLQQINDEGYRNGLSKKAFKQSYYVLGLLMTVYYIAYFIISGLVFNYDYIEYLVAVFVVTSIHNYTKSVRFMKLEKPLKVNLFEKLMSTLGLIYTLFFLYYLTDTRTGGSLVVYLIVGFAIGLIAIRSFKKVKDRENVLKI